MDHAEWIKKWSAGKLDDTVQNAKPPICALGTDVPASFVDEPLIIHSKSLRNLMTRAIAACQSMQS
jgi:hypothetical protein